MRKYYILLSLFLVVLLCFFSCAKEQYVEDEIIGLTSSEIVEKYGNFDREQGVPDKEGIYRDCGCGYLVVDKKTGFFGTTPPEYFMIYFDEDGVACWCRYEQVI